MGLQRGLKSLFWDCDFSTLELGKHRNFIIRRILDRGDWQAITWLRRTVGDGVIRDWLLERHGGGLDPRKLRFWGLILELPTAKVDEWVRDTRMSSWHRRISA